MSQLKKNIGYLKCYELICPQPNQIYPPRFSTLKSMNFATYKAKLSRKIGKIECSRRTVMIGHADKSSYEQKFKMRSKKQKG